MFINLFLIGCGEEGNIDYERDSYAPQTAWRHR